MKKQKMNAKNLMVSFVIVAMALVLVSTVSALEVTDVSVNGILASNAEDISVTAGETATVKVYLTATDEELSKVVVKAEIDGVEVETKEFNVIAEAGSTNSYKKVLDIKIPADFDDDEAYKNVDLEITVESDGDEEASETYTLEVQRPSYDVDFKSVRIADQKIEAGETFPVDILVENTGYNELEDLYVTARIAELGVEQTFYFGDLKTLVQNSADDDDESTISKRLELEVPSDAVTGTYLLEVEVSNEDATLSKTVEIAISNEIAVKSGNDLILLNPTEKPVAYKVVYNEKEVVESVNAGESIRVPIEVPAGEYSFDVKVLSMDGKVVSTTTFSGTEEATATTFESPVVILTVVLAIVFLVLLVVLIVLITKKPEKTDEFGESYY